MKQIADLTTVATEVHPDEPCYGLVEMTLNKNDYHGKARYQLTYVSRNDVLTPYVRDVSSAVGGNLNVPPLRIQSLGDDTVGQVWDLADRYRKNPTLEQTLLERAGESTLISDMLELSQQIQKIKSNVSTFGAGSTSATSQRTGWNLKG